MNERVRDILIIVGLGIITIGIVIWGIVKDDNEKPLNGNSSSSKSTSNSNSSSESNDNSSYDYNEANSRFGENPNTESGNNEQNPLYNDPIWQLTSGSRIVQVDFIIAPIYRDNYIRLDVYLAMTPDELLNADYYREIYINKVLNYLHANEISETNYEMNYIISG